MFSNLILEEKTKKQHFCEILSFCTASKIDDYDILALGWLFYI